MYQPTAQEVALMKKIDGMMLTDPLTWMEVHHLYALAKSFMDSRPVQGCELPPVIETMSAGTVIATISDGSAPLRDTVLLTDEKGVVGVIETGNITLQPVYDDDDVRATYKDTGIPMPVVHALAEVRESGAFNMFDRRDVIEAATSDDRDAGEWLDEHKDRYMDALNAMGEYIHS